MKMERSKLLPASLLAFILLAVACFAYRLYFNQTGNKANKPVAVCGK